MTCNFTSFSTVFQSYQEDESLIMKAVRNGTPFTVEKISPRAGLELWAHQDGLRCPCKQTGNHKVVPLCKNGGKHVCVPSLLMYVLNFLLYGYLEGGDVGLCFWVLHVRV